MPTPIRRIRKATPESAQKLLRSKQISAARLQGAQALVAVHGASDLPEEAASLEACAEALKTLLYTRASPAQLQALQAEFPALPLPPADRDGSETPEPLEDR
jgi:hypothetical protein